MISRSDTVTASTRNAQHHTNVAAHLRLSWVSQIIVMILSPVFVYMKARDLA